MTTAKREHRFGGDWTSRKLAILKAYLAHYGKALKNQPYKRGYIDAFAGTGYRTPSSSDDAQPFSLFPDLAALEPRALLDGSARLALQVEPRFDRYVFIERSRDRCDALEGLKNEFPDRDIDVRQGEANETIQKMCKGNWANHRAVMFLDPYGMQVEWKTIEAIASTRAIDMWLLFPLGIGVNRLLAKKREDIPDPWRRRLTSLLGTAEWESELYRTEATRTLFGQDEQVTKQSMERIGAYFVSRMKKIFAGVAEHPAVLSNSKESPLYLLCFAAANEFGATIALRIAEHILKETR